jgi:hypothetical protein
MFVRFHRSAAGVAWRWRTEIITLAGGVSALAWLGRLTGLAWAGVIIAGSIGLLLTLPFTRRLICWRFWCLLARHRIHRLCYEARLHTRSGRIPLVLWIRPTKVGERAHLLCRAGTCAEDFQSRIGELRAACWARDARVTRHPRWAQLVTIDIIRRDTLAASHTVASPLPGLPARHHPAITGRTTSWSLPTATPASSAGAATPAPTTSRTSATWPGPSTPPPTPSTPEPSQEQDTSLQTAGPPRTT